MSHRFIRGKWLIVWKSHGKMHSKVFKTLSLVRRKFMRILSEDFHAKIAIRGIFKGES